jgi:hypothetical protein
MILFGGGRGSGKTDAGLMRPFVANKYLNPKYRGLVIRKNSDDLSDWVSRAEQIYSNFGAKKTGQLAVFKFPSGATIKTGHLADKDSYARYQGHEYQEITIEELTHVPTQLLFEQLMGSLRSTVPELSPQFFGTANPGGIGHEWVKEYWRIGQNEIAKKFDDNGVTKIYIPANIDDNPYLMNADPDYVNYLNNLPPDLKEKWRNGSWEDFDTPAQFYALSLTKAKAQGRIMSIPIVSSLRTFAAFDLGMRDQMVVWVAQIFGKEVRIVKCYANRGVNIEHYANWLNDLKDKHDLRFEKVFVPHDANVRELTSDGTRFDKMKQLGMKPDLLQRADVLSGIETARDLLTHCYFDEEGCKDGLRALRAYGREFDSKNNRYKDNPLHDWSSDYADSFRYLAQGLLKSSAIRTVQPSAPVPIQSWMGN